MATIWKFPIRATDEFELVMPAGAEILHVETQREVPYIWARVLPERPSVTRRFKVRGTGHQVDVDCKHVGTFMLAGGDLVFHLFEDKRP